MNFLLLLMLGLGMQTQGGGSATANIMRAPVCRRVPAGDGCNSCEECNGQVTACTLAYCEKSPIIFTPAEPRIDPAQEPKQTWQLYCFHNSQIESCNHIPVTGEFRYALFMWDGSKWRDLSAVDAEPMQAGYGPDTMKESLGLPKEWDVPAVQEERPKGIGCLSQWEGCAAFHKDGTHIGKDEDIWEMDWSELKFLQWTCSDKSRILLTDESGGKHCIKFPKQSQEERK